MPGRVIKNDSPGGAWASSPLRRDAYEVLNWLTPDLVTTFARLHEAPHAVATAAIQLLPFGSRAALIELGIARRQGGDPAAPRAVLELTPLAYEVMRVAYQQTEADREGVEGWLKMAQQAAHLAPE
jgi:hypothetical protein